MGGISLERLPRPDAQSQIPVIGAEEKVRYAEQSEVADRVLDGFLERVYQRTARYLDSGDESIGTEFGVLECAAQARDFIKMSGQDINRYPTLDQLGRYEADPENPQIRIYPEIKETYKTFLRQKLPGIIDLHKKSPELPTLDVGEEIMSFIEMNKERRKRGIDELFEAQVNSRDIEHDFDRGMKAIIKHLEEELLGEGIRLIRKAIELYRAIDDTRARDALKGVGEKAAEGAEEKPSYIG